MRIHFRSGRPAGFDFLARPLLALLALVAIALGGPTTAQSQETITITNPREFSAYKQAITQPDARTKVELLEGFLTAYPQSAVKAQVLDTLIDTYQSLNEGDKALTANNHLLQVDPNNLEAIFISVFIKKNQCAKSVDQQTGRSADRHSCEEAATLARKGLSVPKPAGRSEDDWRKMTSGAYPVFHSAIADEDVLFKRDFAGAIREYSEALRLRPVEQTENGEGLWDTLLLATTYARPEVNDLAKSIWFFARASNFVPATHRDFVEKELESYCRAYRGNLDGLEDIRNVARTNLFPPVGFVIEPATSASNVPQRQHTRSAYIKGPTPVFLIPQATAPPPLAKPQLPEVSIWPANDKPVDAAITWDSHGLLISATNSSLQQILKDVATVTGATVEGLDTDQRIYGVYGPGAARDVLADLLRGTSYNVLMIGDQGEGTPREIVLSARSNNTGQTVASNPQPSNDDDPDTDDQPQQSQPPPVRQPFGQRGPMRQPPGMPQPPNGPQ